MTDSKKPTYTITGDTIDEIAMDFAELVAKAARLEVVKAKSEFAVWKLDDGSSDSPIYKSVALTPEQSVKQFKTAAGCPLAVAVDVRLLNLTPAHIVGETMQAKKAATIQRLTKRLDNVESLKAQLARLQQ